MRATSVHSWQADLNFLINIVITHKFPTYINFSMGIHTL